MMLIYYLSIMYQFDEICHIDFTLSHQIFILTSITSHNDAKGLISLTTHMREPSVWLTLSLHCVRSLYYKHHNLLRSVAQWAVRSTNSLVSLRQSLHWQTEQPFSDVMPLHWSRIFFNNFCSMNCCSSSSSNGWLQSRSLFFCHFQEGPATAATFT